MKAILSVSDKKGLVDFAQGLADLKVHLISTGGTKKALAENGIYVDSVADVTGFPEILDGRVKTLHPAIHGGILARRDLTNHMEQLVTHNIEKIDIVVVNLYPFRETVSKEDVLLQDALENIDIGGPTLIRAAAKNFPDVIVVVDPSDYQSVISGLRQGGLVQNTRKRLAQKAFSHVSSYDAAIAAYLECV